MGWYETVHSCQLFHNSDCNITHIGMKRMGARGGGVVAKEPCAPAGNENNCDAELPEE